MPSRPFPPSPYSPRPNKFTKSRVLFLALSISACLVIIASAFYFIYRLWRSIIHRDKTNPFDSSTPLTLQRFSYKDLTHATNGFDTSNVIGKGGSGTVFRGMLRDGKPIAIKRLNTLSLQAEQVFQNELQILGSLTSPFLVTLLGYSIEKNEKMLVYEYMPNRNLQESLFEEVGLTLGWDTRYQIILDVARAIEFLHLGCDPPVIHGDIKPSNVLLDSENRGKLSDFGLSRTKMEGEFRMDLISQELGKSQELWKSQDLSCDLTVETPPVGIPAENANEVDVSLALQASSSTKNSRNCCNAKTLKLNFFNHNACVATQNDIIAKGKEVVASDVGGEDWTSKFPLEYEFSGVEHSRKQDVNTFSAPENEANAKLWGKDWWWRQDGSGELCSKDYVMEWIGRQICPSNPECNGEKENPDDMDNSNMGYEQDSAGRPQLRECGLGSSAKNQESMLKKHGMRRQRKMQEWWDEEELAEERKKVGKLNFKHCRPSYFRRKNEQTQKNGEFSFRRGWKGKNNKSSSSDMLGRDFFSRELSSTTSMRGTLSYAAPECGDSYGFFMEKADIYSLGVLVLVTVSGRRPLHVLASPVKQEKANLISWCRHLAQTGKILELIDERLEDEYSKEQASLCINLALACLYRAPELRPDIGDIVKILKGEIDLPLFPSELYPSPPSRSYSKFRRK